MLNCSQGLPDLVSGELRLGWRSVLEAPALPVKFGTTKELICQLLIASYLAFTYSSFRSRISRGFYSFFKLTFGPNGLTKLSAGF